MAKKIREAGHMFEKGKVTIQLDVVNSGIVLDKQGHDLIIKVDGLQMAVVHNPFNVVVIQVCEEVPK